MHKLKRAFTLIELLVVIAIIAILAAILFPVFAQAKVSAKKAADISNMKQLGTATAMYTADHDDYYFFAANFPLSALTTYGDMSRWSSQVVLGPYMKNTDLFLSPLDATYNVDLAGGWAYLTPAAGRTASPMSYMANALSTNLLGANSVYFPVDVTNYDGPIAPGSYWDGDANRNPRTPSKSTTVSANPAALILYTNGSKEGSDWSGCRHVHTNTETLTGCFGGEDLFWGWDAVNMGSGTNFGAPDRHMEKAWRKAAQKSNFQFSDTHTKTMPPGRLMVGPLKLNPVYFLINPPANYAP